MQKLMQIKISVNHRYQTSLALCNPATPISQPIGRIASTRNFLNTICTYLAYWMIPSAARCYWRLNDPFCSEHHIDGCCEDSQCFWMGWTTPKNCPLPLRDRHPAGGGPSHGDRQHAKKLLKIACVVREICSQTDRQTCSLQYFATAPMGKVIRNATLILMLNISESQKRSTSCTKLVFGRHFRQICSLLR